MKLNNPELRSQLAAAFALGTLTGRARKRFARIAKDDADLRAEVVFWNERLAELNSQLKPVVPSPAVWKGVERQLAIAQAAALATVAGTAKLSINRTVAADAEVSAPDAANDSSYWRAFAIAASLAALALGFGLMREQQRGAGLQTQLQAALDRPLPAPVQIAVVQPMPYVASLQPEGGDARWTVSLSPERRKMRVAMTSGKMPVDEKLHSLELWMLDAGGTPHSLGVLPFDAGRSHDMPLPDMPMKAPSITLAISVEPHGGSPTGKPTGKVVAAIPAIRAI